MISLVISITISGSFLVILFKASTINFKISFNCSWVFVEEIESNISSCFNKVNEEYEWVDQQEEANALMYRFRGIFITSIVGELEELLGRKFSSVFEQLSDTPTLRNSNYWFKDMPRTSSA